MAAEDPRPCADEVAEEQDRGRLVAALYRQHALGLHRLLLGLLRDRFEADEALQQVFLKLLESWEVVRPSTAKGWLYTVAYHEALARRRKDRLDQAALERLWARPAWQARPEPVDPAGALVQRQRRDAVRAAVGGLPDAQRDVVERRMYHDQTFAAIAEDLGCSLNTVLSRMRLAVEKLRRLLEGEL